MSEPLRWRVELTSDQLPELVQRLEWALQHQNQRFATRMPAARMPDSTRRALGIALSLVGLLLLLVLALMSPGVSPALLGSAAAVFALFLVLALALPRVRASSRRFAGRSIARRAARNVRPIARALPAAFDYELHDDHLAVTSPNVGGLRPIAFGRQLVIATDLALFVFARPLSQLLSRTIHVRGDAERAAVLAAFARHGSTHVEVTGPADGYSDPLPPARALG